MSEARPPAVPGPSRLLRAASLAGAPAEVLDFLLPLWAAAVLHVGPAATGALIAVEAAVSLLVRPVAGELTDRLDRRTVAATGAAGYALSCAGYAVADLTACPLPVAFAASAVGGAAGALFWVAVRTWAGEQGPDRVGAYGALLAAEGRGALFGYVIAFVLLGNSGYRSVFWAGAAACAVAAALLATAPGPARGAPAAPGGTGGTGSGRRRARRTLPLLAVAGVTAGGEAGLWLILLVRLQGQGLSPTEVMGVFCPGFLVYVMAPDHAHRVSGRLGRERTMVVAFVAGALFAAGLAVVPSPVGIAVLWALAAGCFAVQVPVEQATVFAAAGDRPGRGMGRYEAARLAGVTAGATALGGLYEAAGWVWACAAAAVASSAGAALVPYALRALGLPAEERAPGPAVREGSAPEKPAVPGERGVAESAVREQPTPAETAVPEERAPDRPVVPEEHAPDRPVVPPDRDLRRSGEERARRERRGWCVHTVLFAVGETALWGFGAPEWVGKTWLTVYVVDTVWSWSYTFAPRGK
ncbi:MULTISPECIES: MFS transporter [unclassified Streptomyces]|uniref:MFS transporter n=1 Tax=unclassified Streptomyces TaxID=2593676 RepID=UPI0033A3B0FB